MKSLITNALVLLILAVGSVPSSYGASSTLIYRCELTNSDHGNLVLQGSSLQEWSSLNLGHLTSPEFSFAGEIMAGPFSDSQNLITLNLLYYGEPGSGYKSIGFVQAQVGTPEVSTSGTVEGQSATLKCFVQH